MKESVMRLGYEGVLRDIRREQLCQEIHASLDFHLLVTEILLSGDPMFMPRRCRLLPLVLMSKDRCEHLLLGSKRKEPIFLNQRYVSSTPSFENFMILNCSLLSDKCM